MDNSSRHHIQSLHSLRFIFIFLIFISHFSWNDSGYWDFGGDCGVCFFFMLSGFVLSLPEQSVTNYKDFVGKRLKKIYPAHLLALLVAFIAIPWGFNIYSTIASIFLLQSWVPSREIYFGANGVAWFLSDILVFYLVFPWLKAFLFGIRWKYVITFFVFAIALYFCALLPYVPEEKVNWTLYVFPPVRLLDFLYGILLARLYRYILRSGVRVSSLFASVLEFGSLVLLCVTLVVYSHVSQRYAVASMFWIPCGAVTLAFAVGDYYSGILSRFLGTKILFWLGAISFEFYLIHVSVIQMASRIVGKYSIELPYAIAFSIVLAFSVIAAAALHRIISRKVGVKYNKILKDRL